MTMSAYLMIHFSRMAHFVIQTLNVVMDLECKRHIYVAMAISLMILTVVIIGDSIISPITIIALKYGVPIQYLEMQVIRVII